jgi:hypothetical protein
VVLAIVVLLVGPLGYAMTGPFGLYWVPIRAAIWTLLFAYAAFRLGKSPIGWALAGGLICGAAWSLAELIGHEGLLVTVGRWSVPIAALWGVAAGLGASLMVGAAFGHASDKKGRFTLLVTALSVGGGSGFLAGVAGFVVVPAASTAQAVLWGAAGAGGGLVAAPIGRRLGEWFRPAVVFFEDLWPYLREMATPLAAFALGYLTITLTFAGFYGTAWRLDPYQAFTGLPPAPRFLDFLFFSVMTATTANTDVAATSAFSQALVTCEVILATGWLIVVFGAISVHLAPRLEAIAARAHEAHKREPEPLAARDRIRGNDKHGSSRPTWHGAHGPPSGAALNLLCNGHGQRQARPISAHNLFTEPDPADWRADRASEPLLGRQAARSALRGENDHVGIDMSAPRRWGKGLASPPKSAVRDREEPRGRPRPGMAGSGSGKKEASHLFFVFPLPPPAIPNPPSRYNELPHEKEALEA